MQISIVIAAYNEQGNVRKLTDEIKNVMKSVGKTYEIIVVDDGSKDRTLEFLKLIKGIKIIQLRKNYGQSAAWLAGFNNANGDLIITMDGDLQNDPKDIPRLIEKLNQGYDVVSGWRVSRKDPILKKLFSRVSNFLRHSLIHDSINDSGCSLKIYKKECLEGIELFGEMHRYICSLIKIQGYKIGEIKVRHRPRIHGKTKYSLTRIVKGFLDLWNIWFWQKFSARPLHLFGGAGILSIFFGVVVGIYTVYLKIFQQIDLSDTFLPILASFSFLAGIQLFVSGILGDILIKSYKQVKRSKGYEIKKIYKNK